MHRVPALRELLTRAASAVALTGLLGVLMALASPGAASAEPPTRLPNYVVDSADAISPAQRTELETAIDSLYSAHAVQMWIVYVRDFDGLTSEEWADRTAAASELGDPEVVEHDEHDEEPAVAVERRAVGAAHQVEVRAHEVAPPAALTAGAGQAEPADGTPEG